MKTFFLSLLPALLFFSIPKTQAQAGKTPNPPNILVIMPDDVGWFNIGAYNHGMMVPTPNIDRLANEGMLFTDHYSAPTCTPGRAMMITGQLPIRTGLTAERRN